MLAFERADRSYRQPVIELPPPAPAAPPAPVATTPPKATKTAPKPKSTTKAPAKTPAKKPASAPKPGTAVAPPSGAAGTVVSFARAQVGKAYVYGASGPNAYDCSGLVQAAYSRVGIKLPHQSESIASKGRRVPAGQWMPGDVIHSPGHVAIYVGGGMQVAATTPSGGVKLQSTKGGTAYRFL